MPAWDRGLGPSATYGPGGQPIAQIEPDGTTRWLHHDQLGSVRLTTNSTDGDQVAKRTFTAYGTADPAQSAGTQPILGYNAQQHDPETGYIYLRARHYDPTTSQFLTRDPLVSITQEPYAYAANDPVNTVDPTGLIGFEIGPVKVGDGCPLGKNSNGSCRGSGVVEKYADDVSLVAGAVASVCTVGAAATSGTGVGAAALGTCAVTARGVSLAAGALHSAVVCADLDAYCARSAASLALNYGGGRVAGAVGPSAPWIRAASDDDTILGLLRWVGMTNVEFGVNVGGFLIDTTERPDC